MQAYNTDDKVFASDNFEFVEINKTAQGMYEQKKIAQGIKNAITLLNGLEESFEKSKQYEDELLKCRTLHKHCHSNDPWNSDASEIKDTKKSNIDSFKSSRSFLDVTESWSTMSIVCLQYQYEELFKRYNTLLETFNDTYETLNSYDDEVLKLRRQVEQARADITKANDVILTIGNKYLTLRQKKLFQKVWYQQKIERLKKAIRNILAVADRACLDVSE